MIRSVILAAAASAVLASVAVAADLPSTKGPPVYAPPPPVAYAPAPVCYNAYPGYDGYCYPATYYTNIGWGFHDGWWWYGGAHYARPFVVGGWHGGYGYRGGWDHDGYRGGYAQQPQYHGGGYGGGYGGGRGGEGGQHGGWGRR